MPNSFYGFQFAYPWVLLGLLLIPLLAWLSGQAGGLPSLQYSKVHLLKSLSKSLPARSGWFASALRFAALALFIVALARPQQVESITRTEASGVDIMLALDVSKSMLAEDFTVNNQASNRLEAIKSVTRDFIEGRPNDRIGIIAFAGRPYLVSPLTLDHEWLLRNLERVRIGLVEDGTAIGSAVASAANRLKDLESKTKLIVLLTDGDNNSGNIPPITAAETAAAVGIKIYPIGAGSRGTARIPVANDMFGRPIYRNIQVHFDEETLREMATIGNGQYFRATDTQSLMEIFKKIDSFEKTKIETTTRTHSQDFFHWVIGLGVGLLALESLLNQTWWRRVP